MTMTFNDLRTLLSDLSITSYTEVITTACTRVEEVDDLYVLANVLHEITLARLQLEENPNIFPKTRFNDRYPGYLLLLNVLVEYRIVHLRTARR
jgi:hypothetical protein